MATVQERTDHGNESSSTFGIDHASLAEDGVWCVTLQNLHKGLSLKGVVILADIRKTIGPLPQSICYPSGDPAVLCKGSSAFLIVDLTFHGQWRLFQVPCQPRSSGSFACLVSHLKICKLQRCRCLRFRSQVVQFLPKSLHPRRLRNTCTSATNVFQAVS